MANAFYPDRLIATKTFNLKSAKLLTVCCNCIYRCHGRSGIIYDYN